MGYNNTYKLNFTVVGDKLLMESADLIDLLKFFKQDDAVKKVTAATKA
jgi:hypothetical protein